MEQWECEIRLKIGLRKRLIRFAFEWKAWMIAYDVFDKKPEEFLKLDPEDQITALAYGAAMWDKIKHKKKVFFSHEDIVKGLNKASKEENKRLGESLKYAQFPEWMKSKKKVTPSH